MTNVTEVLCIEGKSVACASDRSRKFVLLFFGTRFFPVLWIEFSHMIVINVVCRIMLKLYKFMYGI